MTNISKQICEICGVEARLIGEYCIKHRAKYPIKITIDESCQYSGMHINNMQEICVIGSNMPAILDTLNKYKFSEIEKVYRYPDFTMPDNFIKLIELEFRNGETLLQQTHVVYHRPKNRQQFLENVLFCVKNDKHIQQAIKNIEWKY